MSDTFNSIFTKGLVLETYPSFNNIVVNEHIIAFDKIDGSNIRAEWSRKSGFSKFGSRRKLIDENEPILGEAIPLFQEKYSETLEEIFRKNKFQRATAFFEFYGENSFAGFHEKEPHDILLFDLHIYRTGMVTGKEFLKLVGNKVETPEILYEGKPNKPFLESVWTSTLEGMTFEGVMCKGGLDNRNRPKNFKVKSRAWLNKLKNKFDSETYNRLK